VYEFRAGCWWTVPKTAGGAGAGAGATGARPLLTIRATDLLVRIASLKNPAHHRCREIALGLVGGSSRASNPPNLTLLVPPILLASVGAFSLKVPTVSHDPKP
jgi:hypothetical protein